MIKLFTIRHLLTHTSGIGYGVIDSDPCFNALYNKHGIVDLYTTDSIYIKSNIQKLAQLPLHHEPGEGFTYGEGLDLLGYFIEIISQKSLDVFFRERIFEPLEMLDTYFYLPVTHQDRLVPVQTKKDGFWTKYQADFYDTNYPIKGAKMFLSGGAGLSSTTADYSNFLQMFLNQGSYKEKQILGKKTVELVFVNQNSSWRTRIYWDSYLRWLFQYIFFCRSRRRTNRHYILYANSRRQFFFNLDQI